MTEIKKNLTDEREVKVELAKAVQDAMRDSVAGTLISFDEMKSDNLRQLVILAQNVLDWRAIPNRDKGGH